MGLVFREVLSSAPVSQVRKPVELTSANVKFLQSLGFKVQQHVGHRVSS